MTGYANITIKVLSSLPRKSLIAIRVTINAKVDMSPELLTGERERDSFQSLATNTADKFRTVLETMITI